MIKKLVCLCCFTFILAACSTESDSSLTNVDTTNLSQLDSVHVASASHAERAKRGFNQLRLKALKDSAMTIGAQAGLAWASNQVNLRMDKDRKYLETIFNFNAMMLSHGVLPPVLEEGDFSLNLAAPNTIRVADRTYKIVAQARFATTPPNWRDYLWMNYSKPELPDHSLLPSTPQERKVWHDGVQVGWQSGIEQATSIFQQNLARLKRDYRGMTLYRKLLQEKMISAPFVARTELGVTGNNENMRINDQVLRIVELPSLQTNSRHWRAIVIPRSNL